MDDLFYQLNPRTTKILVILLILAIVFAVSVGGPWLLYQHSLATW